MITVLPQIYKKSPNILPLMSYLLVVMYLVRTVLRMSDMLFTFGIKLQLSVQVLTCFLFTGSVITLAYYVRLTIQQNLIANRSFSSAEWKCILYLSVLVTYFICVIIVGGNTQIFNSWKDTTETDLITYCFFQIIVSILFSGSLSWTQSSRDRILIPCYLPFHVGIQGRIVRGKATKSMDLLSLKRAFVRYVSHEIRYVLYVYMMIV